MVSRVRYEGKRAKGDALLLWLILFLIGLAVLYYYLVPYQQKEDLSAIRSQSTVTITPSAPQPALQTVTVPSAPSQAVQAVTAVLSISQPLIKITSDTSSSQLINKQVATAPVPLMDEKRALSIFTSNPSNLKRLVSDAEFLITVPKNNASIAICIRDHECEDGDRVRLLLNGEEIYNGEIYNTPHCINVPVYSGENLFSLYAINGTGGKGICHDRSLVNTGQLLISKINWQSSKWKLSPGEQVDAKININYQ